MLSEDVKISKITKKNDIKKIIAQSFLVRFGSSFDILFLIQRETKYVWLVLSILV